MNYSISNCNITTRDGWRQQRLRRNCFRSVLPTVVLAPFLVLEAVLVALVVVAFLHPLLAAAPFPAVFVAILALPKVAASLAPLVSPAEATLVATLLLAIFLLVNDFV